MSSAIKFMILAAAFTLAACGGGGQGAAPGTDTGTGNVTDPAPGTPQPAPGDDAGAPLDPSPAPSPSDPGNDDDDNNDDRQSPSIVATTPVDRSTAAGTSADITVEFSETLDAGSVTPAAVALLGPSGAVAIDVAVNGETLVIDPKDNLAAGGSYTVTIAAAVKDVAGNAMGADYTWQFATQGGLCADFYASGFSLVEGKDTARMSSTLGKPAKGVPYRDPAYKTCIVRVADHEKEGLAQQSRNLYSRVQPFNADDSYVLVHSLDGYFHLYDAQTTKYIRKLSLGGGSVEPQWHPVNPDIVYVFPNHGGMTISTVNVTTDEKKVVADFRNVKSIHGYAGKTSILQVWPSAAKVWTHWEGSPSKDARYWGLMVETSSGAPLGMITYDLVANVITGVFDYAKDGGGIDAPDHISMSPSGAYVVPSWNGAGENCASRSQLGTARNPCGLMSYTRDFASAKGLTVRGPHSDIGIDANGRDVIVAGDYDSGWVEMWDLATGESTRLFQIYVDGNSTAMHISAKNFAKPGWALVSTYMEKQPGWYASKLFAVELNANPRILNIAHSYNKVETYYSETHAAVNRDFTRIMFNTNWNTANYLNTDAYMVVLPDGAVPRK